MYFFIHLCLNLSYDQMIVLKTQSLVMSRFFFF